MGEYLLFEGHHALLCLRNMTEHFNLTSCNSFFDYFNFLVHCYCTSLEVVFMHHGTEVLSALLRQLQHLIRITREPCRLCRHFTLCDIGFN